MIKLTAYNMDELRKKLGLTSDKALGAEYGVCATSIQHYRKNGVHLNLPGGDVKRVSDLRKN